LTYADITYNDPNRLKRWLQRRRLADAAAQATVGRSSTWSGNFLDFGGGDGALSRLVPLL
jgi:hypothetical protein